MRKKSNHPTAENSGNAFQIQALTIIADLKTGKPRILPVKNEAGKLAGYMIPVTYDRQDDPKLIRFLADVRRKNEQWFPAQFNVTLTGTKTWLKEKVLDVPDRILYILKDYKNVTVGHLGLNRFDYINRTCEIDNIVKDGTGHPGLMTFAINTLIRFTEKSLHPKAFGLQVFSDNGKAIALYERCGFKLTGVLPVVKIIRGSDVFWEEPKTKGAKPDRYYLKMTLLCPTKHRTGKIPDPAFTDLPDIIRRQILLMSLRANSAHVGGALSCVELLLALYFKVMNVYPDNPEHPFRDRFVFSKAHDAKALYAVLSARGFFPAAVLTGYEMDHGTLPGHSTRHCAPGVEVSAGSLGHGMPMAVGMALGLKKNSDFKFLNLDKNNKSENPKSKIQNLKSPPHVFVLISDGECDEGTTWESALFAAHHKLDNLTVIVDNNGLQGYGFTHDVLNLEPLAAKWRAFGFEVFESAGHDMSSIIKTLNNAAKVKGKPTVVIAKTIKEYRGILKYEGTVESQYKPPTTEEFNDWLAHQKKI